MTAPISVVLVDDDLRLRSLLTRYLTDEGFEIQGAADGLEMQACLEASVPDLLILDINLPGEDGMSLCRKLRQSGVRLPIIMLTARGEEADRINGLELGADDYLTKPFNPRELVARMRAVLRRPAVIGAALHQTHMTLYRFGGFTLDLKRQMLLRAGNAVHLSSGEFALLRLFLSEAGKPLSRDQIVARMASREHQPDQRAIDMLVSRLRKRLDDSTMAESMIRTVRSVGYVFVADVTTDASA